MGAPEEVDCIAIDFFVYSDTSGGDEMIFDFGSYRLDADAEATRKAAERIPPANRQCDCDLCENFAAALPTFPPEAARFLDSLGPDPARPNEVYVFYLEKDSCCDYTGIYHIAGNILFRKEDLLLPAGEKKFIVNPNMVLHIAEGVSAWFTDACVLVPDDFPTPRFQLELSIRLPWVLDRPFSEQKIPLSLMKKVRNAQGVLVRKRVKKTPFGKRHLFALEFEEGTRNLRVPPRIYDAYSVGGHVRVTYAGKKLISLR